MLFISKKCAINNLRGMQNYTKLSFGYTPAWIPYRMMRGREMATLFGPIALHERERSVYY